MKFVSCYLKIFCKNIFKKVFVNRQLGSLQLKVQSMNSTRHHCPDYYVIHSVTNLK